MVINCYQSFFAAIKKRIKWEINKIKQFNNTGRQFNSLLNKRVCFIIEVS